MNILHSIWNFLNEVSPEAWALILPPVFITLTQSPLLQFIKKFLRFDDPRRREKYMLLSVMFISFGAPVLIYLRNEPQFTGWFVPLQGFVAIGMTQPFYLYAVKPLSIKFGPWFSGKIAGANNINEAKSAALPAEGLPTISAEKDTF